MEKSYHIGITDNHGTRYALLPGDPDRVEEIARYLDNAVPLYEKREYTSWVGEIDQQKVLVISTGMGGPSAAIAIEELCAIGVDTFIRIGTCGGMQKEVIGGDIVIASGAVRMEGTTREYVPVEYPAVAQYEVLYALAKAAKSRDFVSHVGVVQSKDSFYGQHEPYRMPVGDELLYKWDAWIKAGCLASEMECAAIFTVAGVLRARAGAVLSVVWNQERARAGLDNPQIHDNSHAILTAIDAIRVLIQRDRETVQNRDIV